MNLDQRTATIIMHEGWGKEFDFQMEDEHAYYFESNEQEVKIVKDYEEAGFFSVEGRSQGNEDWHDWDTVPYKDAAAMVAEVEERERNSKQVEQGFGL